MKCYFTCCYSIFLDKSYISEVLFRTLQEKHCDEKNTCWLKSRHNISTIFFKEYEIAINIIQNSKLGKLFVSCTLCMCYISCSTVKS